MGSNKRPFYRIVAVDSRKARDAEYLEKLGYFNPIARGQQQELVIDKAAVTKWLGFGAKPSKTALDLLKREKIWGEFFKPETKSDGEQSKDESKKKKKTRKSRMHPISEMLKRRELKNKKIEFKKKQEDKKAQADQVEQEVKQEGQEGAGEETKQVEAGKQDSPSGTPGGPGGSTAEVKAEAKPVEPSTNDESVNKSVAEGKPASAADEDKSKAPTPSDG